MPSAPLFAFTRYGGEELVVLLPATSALEAQAALMRLQRGLSANLFMHEAKQTGKHRMCVAWRSGCS